MKLARLALGAAASLCSGFVAAWIANGRQAAAMSLGTRCGALFESLSALGQVPVWYHPTFWSPVVDRAGGDFEAVPPEEGISSALNFR
jgi:hypothetical protein